MEQNQQTAGELAQAVANLSKFLTANSVDPQIAEDILRDFVILAQKADLNSSRYWEYPLHYFPPAGKESVIVTSNLTWTEKMLIIAHNELKRSITAVEKFLGSSGGNVLDVSIKNIVSNIDPLVAAEKLVHQFLQEYFAGNHPHEGQGEYLVCRPKEANASEKWLLTFVPTAPHQA